MIKRLIHLLKKDFKQKSSTPFDWYSNTQLKIINLFLNKHNNYDIKKLEHEIKTFWVIWHILEGQKLIKFIEKTSEYEYGDKMKTKTKIFIIFYEWFYFGYNLTYSYLNGKCTEIKEHCVREFKSVKRAGHDYLEYHDWLGWHEYYRVD